MSLSQMIVNWEKAVDLRGFEWKFGQFVVRVLRDDEKDEAMGLIREALRDDPVVSALGFDNASLESIIKCINKHNQNITFGCFTKKQKINVKSDATPSRSTSNLDPNEIPSTSKLDPNETPSTSKQQEKWTEPKMVAVDTLYVRNILDKYPELSKESADKAFIKWLTFTKKIEQLIWTMGDQKICNILTSFGVFVSKEYKDKGIPKEMIKNRKRLAAKLMVDVTGAAIIGEDEQKNAEINKYEIIDVLTKEKLGLDNLSSVDVETIFPIVVMGFKKVCTKKRTIANVQNANKKRKN